MLKPPKYYQQINKLWQLYNMMFLNNKKEQSNRNTTQNNANIKHAGSYQ